MRWILFKSDNMMHGKVSLLVLFQAHSCVMAAASPYLREFIVGQRNDAQLDIFSSEALEALIAYMYSGEVN